MEAFLKASLVKEAIDCCVALNQVWPLWRDSNVLKDILSMFVCVYSGIWECS